MNEGEVGIMGYTIDQLLGFYDANERRQYRDRADRIEDTIMGAQMSGKDVAKTISALRKAGNAD